jgi:hypothetical protein
MGVTAFDIELLEKHIDGVSWVVELGDQINYSRPKPWEYMSEWYKRRSISYVCIDLNGKNGALQLDFTKPFYLGQFDLVTNFGSSEHCCNVGEFDMQRMYQCHKNIFELCKTGGTIICANPKTRNWPGHCGVYYTKTFWEQMSHYSDIDIKMLDEHPALGNFHDGWNVYCIMKKTGERFPSMEEFKTFDLRDS